MQLGDVKRQIYNLGFETASAYEEEPSIITDGINRALREITNRFPLVGEYRLAHSPLPSLLAGQGWGVAHYGGSVPLTYSARGAKSLYFECTGSGELTVADDDGTRVLPLEGCGAFCTYRAFVRGGVRLSFGGAFSYDVKNLALYGELYSQRAEDIPACRRYLRYNLRELTKTPGDPAATPPVPARYPFIEFINKVREDGSAEGGSYTELKNLRIEKRCILVLDGLEKADYTVFYKKDFTPVTPVTPDSFEMELDVDREHLLPLLAAWYVWADDEPAKAAKWRNDYEDFAARILGEGGPDTAQEEFVNALGW